MADGLEKANLHKALREVDAQRVRSEMDRTLLVKDIELLLRTLNAAGLSDPRLPRPNLPTLDMDATDCGLGCGMFSSHSLVATPIGNSRSFQKSSRATGGVGAWVSSLVSGFVSGASAQPSLLASRGAASSHGLPKAIDVRRKHTANHSRPSLLSSSTCTCDAGSLFAAQHLSSCPMYQPVGVAAVQARALADMLAHEEEEEEGCVRLKPITSAYKARRGSLSELQDIVLREPSSNAKDDSNCRSDFTAEVRHFNSMWDAEEPNHASLQDVEMRSMATQTAFPDNSSPSSVGGSPSAASRPRGMPQSHNPPLRLQDRLCARCREGLCAVCSIKPVDSLAVHPTYRASVKANDKAAAVTAAADSLSWSMSQNYSATEIGMMHELREMRARIVQLEGQLSEDGQRLQQSENERELALVAVEKLRARKLASVSTTGSSKHTLGSVRNAFTQAITSLDMEKLGKSQPALPANGAGSSRSDALLGRPPSARSELMSSARSDFLSDTTPSSPSMTHRLRQGSVDIGSTSERGGHSTGRSFTSEGTSLAVSETGREDVVITDLDSSSNELPLPPGTKHYMLPTKSSNVKTKDRALHNIEEDVMRDQSLATPVLDMDPPTDAVTHSPSKFGTSKPAKSANSKGYAAGGKKLSTMRSFSKTLRFYS